MRLLWLPAVLRAAGLTVHEYPGWQTRGSDAFGPLRGVVCHATAGSRTSTDAGEMRVLWETGSTSAPVPISQLYLSRSGAWTVGASGRCNHVLIGDRGPHEGYGNYNLIGVEAQNDNRGEPWSPAMLDSYQRGVAAICRQMGWGAGVVVAHREHQSDKSDPAGVDMTAFRQRVAALLTGDDDMTPEELFNARIAGTTDNPGRTYRQTVVDGWYNGHIRIPAALAEVKAMLAEIGKRVDISDAELAAIGEQAAAAVDEQAIAEGVLAGLGAKSPEDVAAALRAVMTPEQARAVGAILATAE